MGPNRIVSVASAGDKAFYHSDHLGSSNVITNQAGNLISNCEYLPYGEFSTKTGVNATHYYFTGKELDDETGLMFFGARYYDPQIGRFITADPVIPAPFYPQSLNRYSYCYNNPLKYTDPTGHWPDWLDDIIDGVKDFFNDVGDFFSDNWQYIATAAMVAISVVTFGATSPIVIGMIAGSITGGVSAYQAGGDIGSGVLFGCIVGGITGAAAGGFKDYFLNNVFANQFITPMQGGLITSGEFAIGGFGAGVISGYAGGEGDINSMMKSGLIGAGIGAVTGFAVGYSYTAGWQSVLHGADVEKHNMVQGAKESLKVATETALDTASGSPLPPIQSGELVVELNRTIPKVYEYNQMQYEEWQEIGGVNPYEDLPRKNYK